MSIAACLFLFLISYLSQKYSVDIFDSLRLFSTSTTFHLDLIRPTSENNYSFILIFPSTIVDSTHSNHNMKSIEHTCEELLFSSPYLTASVCLTWPFFISWALYRYSFHKYETLFVAPLIVAGLCQAFHGLIDQDKTISQLIYLIILFQTLAYMMFIECTKFFSFFATHLAWPNQSYSQCLTGIVAIVTMFFTTIFVSSYINYGKSLALLVFLPSITWSLFIFMRYCIARSCLISWKSISLHLGLSICSVGWLLVDQYCNETLMYIPVQALWHFLFVMAVILTSCR